MDFLVLKQADGSLTGQVGDWEAVLIARGVEADGEETAEARAVRQGYTGDGRYKAIEWPAAEGSEFDLGPQGPPTATPVVEEAEEEP
jgi:hypothetical protein